MTRLPRFKKALAAAFYLAVFLSCMPALAETGVRVTTDRDTLTLGDTLTLEILMEGDFDDIRGPEMPDFQVLGRSSGSSFSIINGNVSRQQRMTLALGPSREGVLVIGKAELLKDGKVVASSSPLKITVTGTSSSVPAPGTIVAPDEPAGDEAASEDSAGKEPAASQPRSSRANRIPGKLADRQAFILARVPDRTMYAGEPVFLEYVLYTRSDVPVSGLGLNKIPELKGFVVENPSDGSEQPRIVAFGNRRFEERVVWRSAVTAIEPGEAVADPIAVDMVVGDLFSRRRYTLTSEPLKIDFKKVPSEGRPADFIPGTIGTFIVTASLDKSVVKVGESGVLTVEIAGSGNLRALKPPKITEPDGLRIDRVPSSDLDEMRVDRGGVSGRKVFQYVITPRQEGQFDLGRIDVPYFSNVTGTFERARSDRIKFTAAGFSVSGRALEARREVPRLGIIGESSLAASPPSPERMISDRLLATLMIAPVVFFGAVETFWRRKRRLAADSRVIAGRKALRKARHALRQLEKQPPHGSDFWDVVEEIIRTFLDERFSIRAASMTQVELAAELDTLCDDKDAIRRLINELESCAFARFAPSGALDADRVAAVGRISDCLAALDRADRGGAS